MERRRTNRNPYTLVLKELIRLNLELKPTQTPK
jgi:hypothetical protein